MEPGPSEPRAARRIRFEERTTGEVESDPARRLNRSASRPLRTLAASKEICDTPSLVSVYNNSTDAKERKLLHEWLKRYVTWFDKNAVSSMEKEVYEEYASLCAVKAKSPQDRGLARSVFFSLSKRILAEDFEDDEMMGALICAIQNIDELAFGGNPAKLVKLATGLLSKLNPGYTAFTKETHESHSQTLAALHETILLVHRVSPNPMQLDCHGSNFFLTVKDGLAEILRQNKMYFPTLFLVKTTEQALLRLCVNPSLTAQDVSRRILSLVLGCAYFYRGLRAFAVADVDPDALEKCRERIKEAVGDTTARRAWYDILIALNGASILYLQQPRTSEDFLQCFVQAMSALQSIQDGGDRALLGFGIVKRLHDLAETIETSEDQMIVIGCLSVVANRCASLELLAHSETVKALLSALHDLYSQGKNRRMTGPLLKALFSTNYPRLRAVAEEWSEKDVSDDELGETAQAFTAGNSTYIFHSVRKDIGVIYTSADQRAMVDELKRRYCSDAFATVPTLLERHGRTNVKHFKFDIAYDKEIVDEDKKSELATNEDQIALHRERTRRIRESVVLDDLFEDRAIQPQGPPEKIKKILLYGNPGTGKTSIAKRIAYGWSSESWGPEFGVVFVLQMRECTRHSFDVAGTLRKRATLECAVANLCFDPRDEEHDFVALTKQVRDLLDLETTLLVLDGLDEKDSVGDRLLENALSMPCSLLLLSRPYHFHDVRPSVQIDMECVGLNDAQVEEFVRWKLSTRDPESFLSYLKSSPNLWPFAHIPIVANVLCVLWRKKQEGTERDDFSSANLMKIYMDMTNFIWQRFQDNTSTKCSRDHVFMTLERIAFDAFKQGMIQIDETLVMQLCPHNVSEEVLQRSGFLLLKQEGECFQFAHLSYHEFFAAMHLSRKFMDGAEVDKAGAADFVASHLRSEKHRVVLLFFMQSVCTSEGFEGFKQLMSMVQRAHPEETDKMTSIRTSKGFEGSKQLALHSRPEATGKMASILPKLRVLDAFVCSDHTMGDSVAFDNPLVSNLVNDAVSVLRSLRHFKKFGEVAKWVLREVRQLRACMLCFRELRLTLMEGLGAESLEMAQEMLRAAGTVVRGSKDQEQELLDFVSEKVNCEDLNLRKSAVRHLDDVARALPDRGDAIVEMAASALRNQYVGVRQEMVGCLYNVAKALPDRGDAIVELAASALRDRDVGVRKEMVWKLSTIANALSDRGDAIVEMAELALRDQYVGVRKEMVRNLQYLAEALSDRGNAIVELAASALRNQYVGVRKEMVWNLNNVAKALSDRGDAILEMAELTLRDQEAEVRKQMVVRLNHVAQALPDRGDTIVELAELALRDRDAEVRKEMVRYLNNVAQALPDRGDTIVEMAASAMRDHDAEVRKKMVQCLQYLAEALPDRGDTIVELAASALLDRDAEVRKEMVRYLNNVAQALPDRGDTIVEMAASALRDHDAEVRKKMIQCLQYAAEALPDRGYAIVDLTASALRDHDAEVRKEMVRYLNNVAEALPDRGAAIVELAASALRDQNADVRKEMVMHLKDVAGALADRDVAIVELAASALHDQDAAVRKKVVQWLQYVAQALPDRGDTIGEMAASALRDHGAEVRDQAEPALRRFQRSRDA